MSFQGSVMSVKENRQAMNWLMWGGSMVTLFIWANMQDPFNAPKSWVLFVSAMWLLGWVAFQVKGALNNPVLKAAVVLGGGFVLAQFASFLFTGNWFIGLFGESQRRTGFLTYLSLVIFFVAASMLFRASNVSRFNRVVLVVGPLVGTYGLLQHFKIDAIKWNNPYNSVLSTLGNPDFASAVMGIFVVLSVGVLLNTSERKEFRLLAGVDILLLTYTIIASDARQGLLAGALGVGVVVIVALNQKHKLLAYGASALGLVVSVVGLLGMLNDGPLAKYLYKASVTYRGDYWRAGINMFKSHPWFGVGLDRYGAYFREYRDTAQALRRGPDVISNAAHNVPIHLAATGGLFTLVFFVAIVVFIGWRGVVAVRMQSGVKQLVVASIFGAWVTYQAQSYISIDNVGIAIWGWMLGGILVGLSIVEGEVSDAPVYVKKDKKAKPVKSSGGSIAQPLVSGIVATIALGLVIPLFLQDSAMKLSRGYQKPTQEQTSAYISAVKKPLGYGMVDPRNRVYIAALIAQAGQLDQGITLLNDAIKADKRNYDAYSVLADIYEQTSRPAMAAPLRKTMIELDPYNQKNMLKLGQDLKATGDLAGAKALIAKIDAISPSTAEATQAKAEFGA